MTSVGLWGPPGPQRTEGLALRAPRKHKAWGLVDVGWALVALVGAQVLLIPLLVVLALAQYDISLNDPDVAQHLTDAVTKVAVTGPGLVLALVTQWLAFAGVPALTTYRKGHRSLAKDFGFWFKRTDPVYALGLAVVLQLLMAGISVALHHTSLNLSGADNTTMVTDRSGPMLVVMVASAVIGAPLTEELFFRGLLLRSFLRSFARLDLAPLLPGVTDRFHDETTGSASSRRVAVVISALLSAVIFGMMHFQTGGSDGTPAAVTAGTWVVVGQTGLLGLVLAVVAIRTRRIGLTICTHMYFNAASIALVFLTR